MLHVSLQAGPGCHCADESNFTCLYDGQTATGSFVLCDLGEVTFRVECDEPHWTVTATSEVFGEDSVAVTNAATCPGLFLSEELGIGGCNFIFVVTV